jgi:hypothetical protein
MLAELLCEMAGDNVVERPNILSYNADVTCRVGLRGRRPNAQENGRCNKGLSRDVLLSAHGCFSQVRHVDIGTTAPQSSSFPTIMNFGYRHGTA